MKNKIIQLSPISLVIVLVGEFSVMFALGLFYEDYSYISMVMNELESAHSPVALWMSL